MTSSIIALLIVSLAGCGSKATASSNSAGPTTDKVTTIQAVTGGSPAPFVTQTDDGSSDGQNVELTKAIFKKLPQYNLHWNVADFKAIFPGLDSGRFQIAVNNFAKTPEREKNYIFSSPIYTSKYVAVVAKGSTITKINSLQDISGKKIVVCGSGCNIATGLESYNTANPNKKVNLVYTQSETADSIRQVENSKADLYLLDEPSYGWYKKKAGYTTTHAVQLGDKAQEALQSSGYSYLVFPKGQEHLRDDVNKAFKQVIADGTSKRIDEKWFGENLTPSLNELKK